VAGSAAAAAGAAAAAEVAVAGTLVAGAAETGTAGAVEVCVHPAAKMIQTSTRNTTLPYFIK